MTRSGGKGKRRKGTRKRKRKKKEKKRKEGRKDETALIYSYRSIRFFEKRNEMLQRR